MYNELNPIIGVLIFGMVCIVLTILTIDTIVRFRKQKSRIDDLVTKLKKIAGEVNILYCIVYIENYKQDNPDLIDRVKLYKKIQHSIDEQLYTHYGHMMDSDKLSRVSNIITIKLMRKIIDRYILFPQSKDLTIQLEINLNRNEYRCVDSFNTIRYC